MNKVSHDSETPAHGQQVISVCAFIHHEFDGVNKVFLPKRADTKKFLPGLYELPGGHVDLYEDIVDGLKREVMEEFGMKISVGDPFAVFTYENQVKGSHTVEVIYFARFTGPIDKIQINPEDHSRYDWFTQAKVIERKAEMTPVDQAVHKEDDQDAEYKAILKGFDLLSGKFLSHG